MQVFIPAEGKGTRLLPNTHATPKPLITIAGTPILEHIIRHLVKSGAIDFFISVYHLKDQLKEYFGDGTRLGCKITYIEPEEPQGTAGALRQIQPKLNDEFLVMYCDYFVTIDVGAFFEFHRKKIQPIASVLTQKYPVPKEVDHVEVDNNDKILRMHNRPHELGNQIKNLASTGMYVCNRDIFEYIDFDKPTQFFETDIFPKILLNNKNIYAYYTEEYIEDMGTHNRRAKVENDIITGNTHIRSVLGFPEYV